MGYTSTMVTAAPNDTVMLGDAVLHAEAYAVRLSCPVTRARCADGQTLVTVHPQADAIVQITGRAALLDGAAGTLLQALESQLNGAPCEFTLGGCAFTGMQLTEVTLEKGSSLRTGSCTVSLTGSLGESGGDAA